MDYVQLLAAVPTTMLSDVAAMRAKSTTTDRAVWQVLQNLCPDQFAQVSLGAMTYRVYGIHVNSDTDVGMIKRILDTWPSIKLIAAFWYDGMPVYKADGATLRFSITPTQYAALKAAWDPAFIDSNGKLTPPNVMAGQVAWSW